MPDFVEEIMFINSFNLYSLTTIAAKIVVDCIIAISAIHHISKHKCYKLLGYTVLFIITGFNGNQTDIFSSKSEYKNIFKDYTIV
jgi:hypothetical protein